MLALKEELFILKQVPAFLQLPFQIAFLETPMLLKDQLCIGLLSFLQIQCNYWIVTLFGKITIQSMISYLRSLFPLRTTLVILIHSLMLLGNSIHIFLLCKDQSVLRVVLLQGSNTKLYLDYLLLMIFMIKILRF